MAGREIIPSGPPPVAQGGPTGREAKRQAELWQGYSGHSTPNAGWEITVQTSKWNFDPLWLALLIFIAIVMLVGYGTPPPAGPNDLAPAPAMLLAGLATAFALGLPLGFLYGQYPKLMRRFDLESIEIRPDGITINPGRRNEGFFGRDEVLTIGVETVPNEPERFRYCLAGVIGARHVVLLRGLEQPMAQRLGHDLEKARRMLWQQGG